MPFFDLASLTKPLVAAPLVLDHLDLDADRRAQLGFEHQPEPLTVRQLLSHSAGLPPWLPFTAEPLGERLRRGFPAGAHPLLREGEAGWSVYSDLGYRLLAELLERELGRPFPELGRDLTGLLPAPWRQEPVPVPDGPDRDAWSIAESGCPPPARAPGLPHDANARAGMRGHAGFGGTPGQLEAWIRCWIARGYPARMAVDTARSREGARWGLGLQRAGLFGDLLAALPGTPFGVRVAVDVGTALPAPRAASAAGFQDDWWYHLGYTGGALFVRPVDGSAVLLLCHRRGPAGELLDTSTLEWRRRALLERVVHGRA